MELKQDLIFICAPNSRVTQQSPSWLPVVEKHDIPIVVGVGVSLAFMFITVFFYSVVQKNQPVPPNRAGWTSSAISTVRTHKLRVFITVRPKEQTF